MTQLDVPQLSLARYLDLLKRRRWQVIPVSLLGLLIGGVVAFFIPRYFVATAAIAYQQPPGYTVEDPEDPFGARVDSAKLTIPLAIPETIQALGWPEGETTDAYELSANSDAIEQRLDIFAQGNSQGREYVLIRVTYKDRDGERAANFLNKLAATWIKQQQDELRTGAERRRAAATKEQSLADKAYDSYVRERQNLQQTYLIEPSVPIEFQIRDNSKALGGHAELVESLEAQKQVVADKRVELEHARKLLREMPSRVEVDPMVLKAEAAKSPQGKALLMAIANQTLERDNWREGTPQRAKEERKLAALTKEFEALQPPGLEIAEDGTMVNLARDAMRAKVDMLEVEYEKATAALGLLEKRIEKQEQALQRQAEGYALYTKNADNLEQAKAALEAAGQQVKDADAILAKLTNDQTVRLDQEARVPPMPTDPNLLLVALIGCVIGLLAATVLVLLLDILQGSYKTIDDVERNLDVPVLGGVSHLETEAERLTLGRARRRATLFAATMLVLVSGVVLIYYYDPTRLPPFVRDMLAIVLGTRMRPG